MPLLGTLLCVGNLRLKLRISACDPPDRFVKLSTS